MSEKRRDSKGRLLHNGEIQQKNGRYRFKYYDFMGKDRYVYSWRLDKNDPIMPEHRSGLSFRELERQIQADRFDNIAINGGNYTVLELVNRYIQTKTGVRNSTRAGYQTVIRFLEKNPFGEKRIDNVRISDVKLWLIGLQKKGKAIVPFIRFEAY